MHRIERITERSGAERSEGNERNECVSTRHHLYTTEFDVIRHVMLNLSNRPF